ncbi:hypothetical protein [Glycomyces tenuis]|uniref:hypothetical protein n=1 Tax=Glycomyces tenuis TaxID=58116 RepID=UPI0003F5AD03|nr:hypothetical protein [Glycomyces tenuis]
MPKRQRLAPKGLGEAESAAAILSHGYGQAEDPEPEPEPAPPPAAAAKPVPASATKPSTRGDAEGMTRRTYYLAAADADVLEDAVAAIHTAMHGLVPKHRILGAILAEGLVRRDAVTQRLKAELLAGLD